MTQHEFYHTKKWSKFRQYAIAKELEDKGEIICAECGKPILERYDLIVHHKERLSDDNVLDPAVSLNTDNVVFLHRKCHEMEHGRLFRFPQSRGVYLVYGCPLSGKSTLVRREAKGDDFILDFNSLQDAIGIERAKALVSPAVYLREAGYQIIERRLGLWRRAFIVGGYPDKIERQRLVERLGATEIFVDISEDEAYRRAKNDSEKKWIAKWFDTYKATTGIVDMDAAEPDDEVTK